MQKTLFLLILSSSTLSVTLSAQSFQEPGHLHGDPGENFWISSANGVTDEGILIGDYDRVSGGGPPNVAYSWKNGVFTELPFTRANWISPNGRVILGENDLRDAQGGFIRTEFVRWEINEEGEVEVTPSTDGPVIELNETLSAYLQANGEWNDLDDFNNYNVNGVSEDQKTFVGTKFFPGQNTDRRAAIWTANSETLIPLLPGDGVTMEGLALSGDGSIVVGKANVPVGPIYGDIEVAAFIWDAVNGTRLLTAVAEESIPDWNSLWDLDSANAISPDGRFVVGHGCLDGETVEPWFMELPPTVSLRIKLPEETLSVGDIVPVEVLVRSTIPKNVPVVFTNAPLISADSTILEVEPIEVEPFVLTPDDHTKIIEVQVTVKAPGNTTLSSEIEFAEDGEKVTKSKVEEVTIPSLVLTLKALPLIDGNPIRNYELDEDNNPTDQEGNPVTPKIEITVENLATQPVDAVLQGVDPRARDDSAVVGRIKTLGEFPIELGTLVKGTPKSQEIDLQLMEDGRFEFSALVTGSFQGTTKQFNVARKGAKISVGEPYPVEIEMQFVRTPTITNQSDATFFVTPGGEIKIIAAVNNLTSNSTLFFNGIEAEKHRNLFGALLTSEDGNLVEPPFAHDHEIDANSAVVLSGIIKTDPLGAPTGTVKWILPDDAYLIDDQTEERTDLSEDDFLVTTEIEGWLDEEYSLKVIQDFSQPFPAELTSLEHAVLVTGNFTRGALVSMAKWTHDTFDAIGGLGSVAGTISADPSLLSDALGEGARTVWETAEFIHLGWSGMSPGQKDAFILSAVDETYRRAQFFVTAPFEKESYSAALAFTRDATYGLFGGVSDAYASNDPARIAELYGNITGNIAMEVGTALLPTPKFTRYVDGAELANLAKAADNIRSLNQQQRILQNVPAGLIGRRLAIDGWGIGGKHLDDVQSALRQLHMKGYARERAPRSITLSEVLDEAVLKPQAMKPKGFSDLDRLMLGNHVPTVKGKNGADLDLDAITVVMWPPENALIRSRLSAVGETEETIKAVLARADSRRKEYKKRFPEFLEYKEKGIPVEFDYKSNDSFATKPNRPEGATRSFDYDTIDTDSGARIHVPKMGNDADELRYITGDVDWIHFSWLDGTPLDAKTAGNLYEVLERCCGLQHGETVTWINKGQAVFEGKAEQIGEYLVGKNQKALLEVTGDSIRAVRVNPKLTRFAKDARNHLIFFDGGTKSLLKAKKGADLENAFAVLFEQLPPRKVILPFLWFSKDLDFDDPTIDGQTYSYNNDPDAVLARQGENGNLEYFDGTAWQPWDQKQNPNPFDIVAAKGGSGLSARDGEPLNLTPTSILLEPAERGSLLLPLADLAALWPEQMEGLLLNWFDVGDTIVIAPGTSRQEIRKLVNHDPLTLNRPLDFYHFEDTLVAVLPAVLVDKIFTSDAIRFSGSQWVENQSQLAFEFSFPFQVDAVFEISSDLLSWAPVPADAIQGGTTSNNAVTATYPDEIISIKLDLPSTSRNKYFLRWHETSISGD